MLFISLFLSWYSVSAKSNVGGFSGPQFSRSGSGWEALGFIDILLAACALIAIALAVLRMAGMLPSNLPVTPGLILLGVGALATLLVLFRLLVVPDGDVPDVPGVDIDWGRKIGVFLAMIAAIAMAVGGFLAWGEEGRPKPGSTGAGAGGAPGGGGQVGAGQPHGGQPVAGPGPQATAAPPPQAAGGGAPSGGGMAPPAGGKADWYPDPQGQKRLRYFDGTSWTEHTAD